MSSEESPVLLDVAGGVATVTMNRPAVLNALNNDLAEGLFTMLGRIESDRAIRVVVFRGAGDAFMAGGDIGYFPIRFEPSISINGVIIGILVTIGAGYIPARKAAKVDPISIFRR